VAATLCHAVLCSRCTGYRPILDAFKVFAKSEPSAYAADAIAAAKGMAAATAADNAAAGSSGSNGSNGHLNGSNGSSGMVCPSSGLPCDCGGGSPAAAAPAGPCGSDGCGNDGGCAAKVNGSAAAAAVDVKPSSEPIFPKELKGRAVAALKLEGGC
jgi:xanthine dehydrogenase/oxidase